MCVRRGILLGKKVIVEWMVGRDEKRRNGRIWVGCGERERGEV